MKCSECKWRYLCLVACDEVNEELCEADEERGE